MKSTVSSYLFLRLPLVLVTDLIASALFAHPVLTGYREVIAAYLFSRESNVSTRIPTFNKVAHTPRRFTCTVSMHDAR
jgi:hypothetical protein